MKFELLEIDPRFWDRLTLFTKGCLVIGTFFIQLGFKASGVESGFTRFGLKQKPSRKLTA